MPDPRDISVVYTIVYIVTLYTGIVTILQPPSSLSLAVGGPQTMALVGILMTMGAVAALVGGAGEWWRMERIGVLGAGAGVLIYAAIVLGLHLTTEGSRLTQLGVIVLAELLFVVRMMMIRTFTFRPGR